MIKDGASQYFNLVSNVEAPKVALNRLCMNLGRIYAGVPEYINPQSKHHKSTLVLNNYGNLSAHFKWKNINDPDRIVCNFEPSYGIIQPRSEIKIKMTVNVFTGGNLNELFMCDIRDMEMPLGFEMLADAYGLNVSYENQDDQPGTVMNQSHTTFKTKTSDRSAKLQMTQMKFPHCTINKTSS